MPRASVALPAGRLLVHGVDHASDIVPVHERGHDHGLDHGHGHVNDHGYGWSPTSGDLY